MIKVFLVIVACWQPYFLYCQQLMAIEVIEEVDPMYWCLLNRPAVVSMWQTKVNDGWVTFSRCQIVNPTQDGRLG